MTFEATEREDRVRFVDFTNDWEGIIEARGNISWNPICDDGWDMSAGDVVCRMLGYERALGTYIGLNSSASNPYILDDIACDGTETDIMDCDHGPLLEHDCTQNEHAGVSCLPGEWKSYEARRDHSYSEGGREHYRILDYIIKIRGVISNKLIYLIIRPIPERHTEPALKLTYHLKIQK